MKVAFFVDGNFMRRKIYAYKSFVFCGKTIREYCSKHLRQDECFYRIFYYDAPPLERKIIKPFGTEIDFGNTDAALRQKKLLESIRETPNMALRLGKVRCQKDDWNIKKETLQDIINGIEQALVDDDFYPNIQQKAVDMKIGLDIATVTYKKLADRIVLIAGDSDFSPAAKLARMEGMHVTLDSLGNNIPDDLLEHIDVACTILNPEDPNDVAITKKSFFKVPKKTINL